VSRRTEGQSWQLTRWGRRRRCWPTGRELEDRALKRVAYAEAGVPSYWMVDPDEPSLVVLELDQNGEVVETARPEGDGALPVERPYR